MSLWCVYMLFLVCVWICHLATDLLTDALSGLSGAERDAPRFATVGGTQWEPDK